MTELLQNFSLYQYVYWYKTLLEVNIFVSCIDKAVKKFTIFWNEFGVDIIQ